MVIASQALAEIHVKHPTIAGVSDAMAKSLSSFGEVFLVGNSMGALVAMDFASRYPARVKSVTLSGAPGLGSGGELGVKVNGKLTLPIAHSMARRLFYDVSCLPQGIVENSFRSLLRPAYFTQVVHFLRQADNYDVEPAFRALAMPVQLLWGFDDAVTPVEPWKILALQCGKTTITEMHHAGHSPQIEQPDAFAAALLAFLSTSMQLAG